MTKVEFVSYTGKYPNLCSGVFTAKINGVITTFGYNWCFDDNGNKPQYPPFWYSGGDATFGEDGEHISWGPWELRDSDRKCYPKEIWNVIPDLIRLMNENVEQGCCGGCL